MSRSSSLSSLTLSLGPPMSLFNPPSKSSSRSEAGLAHDPKSKTKDDTEDEEPACKDKLVPENRPIINSEPTSKDEPALWNQPPSENQVVLDARAFTQNTPEPIRILKRLGLVDNPSLKLEAASCAQVEPTTEEQVNRGMKGGDKFATNGSGDASALQTTHDNEQQAQLSEVDNKSVTVIHGSDCRGTEDHLEEGEVVDLEGSEEGEIVDVDPEPLTNAAVRSLLGNHPTVHDTSRDRCLHWLGHMRGEVMEGDLVEKTWRTKTWSIHSFVAIRGVRIYNFFDTIQSGLVTYSPPPRYAPLSRWNFYPEHVTTTFGNTFERTAGDIEFRIDGDRFRYYVWSFLIDGDEIIGNGEIGMEHPEISGYYLHHHYNQPPMWLFQPRPRPLVNSPRAQVF